jgi:hypothetical protein
MTHAVPLPSLRSRLLARVAASARASRAFFTVRGADGSGERLADGVLARTLYAAAGPARRTGEPTRVRLLALAPHARWQRATDGERSEWLLLHGAARLGDAALGALGYRFATAGESGTVEAGADGARLYLRESVASDADVPIVGADAPEAWLDFAPGIRRRLLWSHAGEASMLYRADAGARVPQHGHVRDEECLMVAGELFLDDVLLRDGDWQLAPAGTGHASVLADTPAIVFAHGDVDLALMP